MQHLFNYAGWYFDSFSNGTLASETLKEKLYPDIAFPTMSFPANYIHIKSRTFQLHLDCMTLLKSVGKGDWAFMPTPIFEGFAVEDGADFDYERLKDTSIPILHYAKVLFYEDEVDDRGQIQVQAQLRVMPFGFFLLLRYYFKLDIQTTTSVKEYRIYHAFEDQRVILEVSNEKDKTRNIYCARFKVL